MWNEQLIAEAKQIISSRPKSTTCPTEDQILRFTELAPPDIKVIILGQDPYPTPGVANGRAFAVNKTTPIPASLRNIFAEINQVQGFVKADRTLQHWVDQGVLLLNTALTVQAYSPGSDHKLWAPWIKKLLIWLDQHYTFTCVLWGKAAQTYAPLFHNRVIIDAHPSPLSVRLRKQHTFKQLSFIDW